VTSSGIMFILNFVEIVNFFQKLEEETYRKYSDDICLIFSLKA
jgi:hypothetical protein